MIGPASGTPPERVHSVAVIAGDGIGIETTSVAQRIVDEVSAAHGFRVGWDEYPWGSAYHRQHGRMMPTDGLTQLAKSDAVLFGAVGAPDIADTETLWGLLIPMRRGFQQYVNLRPARYLAGVRSPLRVAEGIDLVIVRENTEGEYSEVGGRFGAGTATEFAAQEAIFTRSGIERVARYACELAQQRRGVLTSATKSNGIVHTMPFWDEVVAEIAGQYQGLTLRSMLVDAMAAALVSQPQSFDVIVASNLFGDILSDLTAAVVGSIGLAPSANINPEREFPSTFEPVHGSAPDIAGKGVANPLAQVSSAAMMLDHLGEGSAARAVETAVGAVLAGPVSTPDLGGTAGTSDILDALLDHLAAPPPVQAERNIPRDDHP
jgi:tartrate dehydrogenase/decarboxylase/D-malate dehydrogenase